MGLQDEASLDSWLRGRLVMRSVKQLAAIGLVGHALRARCSRTSHARMHPALLLLEVVVRKGCGGQ